MTKMANIVKSAYSMRSSFGEIGQPLEVKQLLVPRSCLDVNGELILLTDKKQEPPTRLANDVNESLWSMRHHYSRLSYQEYEILQKERSQFSQQLKNKNISLSTFIKTPKIISQSIEVIQDFLEQDYMTAVNQVFPDGEQIFVYSDTFSAMSGEPWIKEIPLNSFVKEHFRPSMFSKIASSWIHLSDKDKLILIENMSKQANKRKDRLGLFSMFKGFDRVFDTKRWSKEFLSKSLCSKIPRTFDYLSLSSHYSFIKIMYDAFGEDVIPKWCH